MKGLQEIDKGARASARWCLGSLGSGMHISLVIATLPDPVRSHLVLDFDHRIDAIQAAAAKEDYVLDRFWLPWSGIRTDPSANPDLKGNERVLQQLRLAQPGLEIYRPVDRLNQSDLLFVFLVGETPTGGVDLAQLEEAIQYADEVQRGPGNGNGAVKLLAPAFSGSIPALSEFLKRKLSKWNEANKPNTHPQETTKTLRTFEIVTSSATDPRLLKSLSEAAGAGHVHAVVHDDGVALQAFTNFAKVSLNIADSQIAIVSESETAYGEGISAPETAYREGIVENSGSKRTPPNIQTFTFPREIYRLRNVYPDAQTLSQGQHPANLPNYGLDLNLKVSPGGDSGIPSFAREELPLSQEAELLAVAEAIHRKHIKLVGVAATDVFDTLFVLRFLREFCPDTRLFVLDSDILFIRAADVFSLQGTLAVTDYPLSNAKFPSRSAEITYNSFLDLTGHADLMLDYKQPGKTEMASQPQLWLRVVSRNGFQPVRRFSELDANLVDLRPLSLEHSESPVKSPVPTDRGPSRQNQWETQPSDDSKFASGANLGVAYFLLVLTVAQLACAIFARKERTNYAGWLLEFFHVSKSEAGAEKACFLGLSFIVLAVLNLFTFSVIWSSGSFKDDATGKVWYLVLCSLGVLGMLSAIAVALYLFVRHRVHHGRQTFLFAACVVATACYSFAWIGFIWFGEDSESFLQRCLDLSNGTSPLLPHLLLLFVFYLWSLTHVRRIHLWESRRQSIALKSLDDYYQSDFLALDQHLTRYFEAAVAFIPTVTAVKLAIVLAVVVMSARPLAHLASFEPFAHRFFRLGITINYFDALYVLFAVLCAFLLGSGLFRFALGWSALLNVLRRLERQPIRHAFDRLPKKFYSWTPLWHSGGARRSLALQTRALECLEKLSSYADAPDFPKLLKQYLQNRMDRLRIATAALLRAEAEGKLDLTQENAINREVFLTAADSVIGELLLPYWEKTGDCESIEQHEKEQAEKPDRGVRHVFQEKHPPLNHREVIVVGEEFVALRFVALMRYVGVQLRNMLSFVVAGFMLCVASVRSYPFLAHRTIGWGLTVVFLIIGIPVVIAFAQMDKDAILSRLSDTDPGKLDRAFYVRLISYGGLPLLTVLASQFPSVGRFLFSWVQPAIESLH